MHSLAQVVSSPLLVDYRLVNLSSGEVVVFGETDVQETLIVPQVQIHFPAIIENKYLTCRTQTLQTFITGLVINCRLKLREIHWYVH